MKPLGVGTDGAVWYTTRFTALKAFYKERNFELELECYHRLHAAELQKVGGFWVPQLIGHDAHLLVIEMSIVKPPYVLDFGKVYLDRQPDFSPEVLRDWRDQQPPSSPSSAAFNPSASFTPTPSRGTLCRRTGARNSKRARTDSARYTPLRRGRPCTLPP